MKKVVEMFSSKNSGDSVGYKGSGAKIQLSDTFLFGISVGAFLFQATNGHMTHEQLKAAGPFYLEIFDFDTALSEEQRGYFFEGINFGYICKEAESEPEAEEEEEPESGKCVNCYFPTNFACTNCDRPLCPDCNGSLNEQDGDEKCDGMCWECRERLAGTYIGD